MFALVHRNIDRTISLSLTQIERRDAEWYRDEYARRWPTSEWIVVPFLSYVDQRRSSGTNPHPVRPDFDFDHWLARQERR